MIRVLILEEVRAMCEVIAAVLGAESDVRVVGCATTFDEASACLDQCDVVLVNAGLRDDVPLLIHTIRKTAPQVKVVVMGLAKTKQAILQCIQAGVSGYVLKEDSLAELLRNIRAAHNNEARVSPPMAAALMAYIAELAGTDKEPDLPVFATQNLTRREREVLNLVQQGLTNQEIAESLVIELGTVKNHVHNILRKLNVNSRHDAVYLSRFSGFLGHKLPERPKERRPELQRKYNPALSVSSAS